MVGLMPSLYQVLSSLNKVRAGQASVVEVYSDMRRLAGRRPTNRIEPTAPEVVGPSIWRFKESIVFDQVGFSYPKSASQALADISLQISKGTSVGFVGASGAGKATIVDLLLGLFPTTSGSILVDNVPLGGDMITKWRSRVAYVPQEIFLIDGTVRDNVSFSSPEINTEQVWSALQRAHAPEFVAGFRMASTR